MLQWHFTAKRLCTLSVVFHNRLLLNRYWAAKKEEGKSTVSPLVSHSACQCKKIASSGKAPVLGNQLQQFEEGRKVEERSDTRNIKESLSNTKSWVNSRVRNKILILCDQYMNFVHFDWPRYSHMHSWFSIMDKCLGNDQWSTFVLLILASCLTFWYRT